MVNEELLGALKSSLARGESLKKAMMSLYNAGYKKEEISEAAKSVNQSDADIQAQKFQQEKDKQPKKPTAKTPAKPGQPTPQTQQLAQQHFQQPMQQPGQQTPLQPGQQPGQQVSAYGQMPKPGGKTAIIILGFVLLLLAGVLVAIFLFKDSLIDFFNNMFN